MCPFNTWWGWGPEVTWLVSGPWSSESNPSALDPNSPFPFSPLSFSVSQNFRWVSRGDSSESHLMLNTALNMNLSAFTQVILHQLHQVDAKLPADLYQSWFMLLLLLLFFILTELQPWISLWDIQPWDYKLPPGYWCWRLPFNAWLTVMIKHCLLKGP